MDIHYLDHFQIKEKFWHVNYWTNFYPLLVLKIFGSLCKQVLCPTGKFNKDKCASRNYKIIINLPVHRMLSAKVVFTKN